MLLEEGWIRDGITTAEQWPPKADMKARISALKQRISTAGNSVLGDDLILEHLLCHHPDLVRRRLGFIVLSAYCYQNEGKKKVVLVLQTHHHFSPPAAAATATLDVRNEYMLLYCKDGHWQLLGIRLPTGPATITSI